MRVLLLSCVMLLSTSVLSFADDEKKTTKPTPPKRPTAADRDGALKDLLDKPAPDIQGEFALNGKLMPLKELKGKVVLVDFWAVWCGPCIATFPHLRDLHSKYHKDGLEIVGVTGYYERFGFDKEAGKLIPNQKLSATEEQAMLKDFAAHHKLAHRLVVVSAKERTQVYKDYKVTGIPHVAVIDRKGMVRLIKVGSGEANAKAIEEMIKKLLDDKV